jgi:glycosyltransferase involved in cell wall biosynthesis
MGRVCRLVLLGSADDATRRCIEESGVGDCATTVGYVSHRESVSWLTRADALFLPLHGLPRDRRSLIVPGKLFEYLAARKPILACLPQGDARDIIEESGNGAVADPTDAADIMRALDRLFQQYRDRQTPLSLPASLQRFSRSRLAAQLASFLNDVCSASTRPSPTRQGVTSAGSSA